MERVVQEMGGEQKEQQDTAQFVIFRLGNEHYAVPIADVREIIRVPDVTRVPGSKSYIEGVINLRSNIIVVVDLRKKVNLAPTAKTDKARIIVLEYDKDLVGIFVDEVLEVLYLPVGMIQEAPKTSTSMKEEYMKGVCVLDNRVIILLDFKKILELG